MSTGITEIRHGSTNSLPIEEAIKAAFPRGTVLRTQLFEMYETTGTGEVVDADRPWRWLVLANTQRTFGHFAVLEWNNSIKVLHSGHYFDSMAEAVTDFNARGGNLNY